MIMTSTGENSRDVYPTTFFGMVTVPIFCVKSNSINNTTNICIDINICFTSQTIKFIDCIH